jgi:phage protein U
MTSPLFQLGEFQFDLPNGVPQTLDRGAEYRWEEQPRLLRDPAWQFIGPGSQQITLAGVLYPQTGFSGRVSTMDQLRELAGKGKPLMFSAGNGKVFGRWAIRNVREGQSLFVIGGSPRQIEFTVELVRYGEDNPGEAASPLSIAFGTVLNTPLTQGITGAFTDPGSPFGALAGLPTSLTQAATGKGFSLGQLASIAQSGIRLAGQVSSGDYVGAALGTMGAFGIDPSKAGAWGQIGINAANLAQSYAQGNGPTGMALALEAASAVGAPALQQSGIVQPQDLQSVGTLLQSTATLGEILKVDPKTTETLRPLIQLTGGG